MSNKDTSTETATGRKPDFDVCSETNGYWTRIGAAWKSAKNDSISIRLDYIPLSGNLVLFPPKAKDEG